MDSRAAAAHKFRTRLGYKQYVVVTMSPIIMSYKNKKFIEIRKHANTLQCVRFNLAIAIDQNGHRKSNIDNEIKRQKEIKQTLGCEFIKTDPDKEYIDILKALNKMFRHVKQFSNQLTKQLKKTDFNKISIRLLGLNIKSENILK